MNQFAIGDIVRGDREVFPPYLYEAYQSTWRRTPMPPQPNLFVLWPYLESQIRASKPSQRSKEPPTRSMMAS